PGRATAELFQGATWFLTPLAATEPERYRSAHALATMLGARPVAIDPTSHDRLVAVTSHLPHALANVLVNHAGASRVDGHDPLALHRVRVHIPDRPGILAGIFQALGAQRINVADFDLEHLSPERGGTLTILVTGEADAAGAARLLEAQGYGVVVAPVLQE